MGGLGAGEGEEPNYVNATSSSGAAYGAAPSPAYGAPASSPAPAFAAPSATSQFNNVVQVTMEADPFGRRARIVGMRAIEPEAVCIWHRRCAEAFSAGCSGGSIVVVSPTASPTAVPSWR